jgi:hypothetical protein
VPQVLQPTPNFSPCRPDRADEESGVAAERVCPPNYLGSRAKLLWRCRQGHQWFAVPRNTKRWNWCPVCAGNRRLNLKDYRAFAAKHGGKCLSRRYKNNDTKFRWRCAKGHKWSATGSSAMRGSWCARCAHTRRMGTLRRKPGHL